jgi:hypothetical protein
LVSKSRFDQMKKGGSWTDTKLIYDHFYNKFDFLMTAVNLYSPSDEVGDVGGYFIDIENSITGLGESIFDKSILSGFGYQNRATGRIQFHQRDGLTSLAVHEIGHNFGNYALETGYSLHPSHWGYSNIGGSLGGWQPNSLESLGNGQYRARSPTSGLYDSSWSPWTNFHIPYSNFELYLMGLISASEVGHDIKIAEDFKWVDINKGIFQASSITTKTINQFIAENGARLPNYLNSQKSFRGMYIVVSEAPLTLEEWRIADKAVFDFQNESDNGFYTVNFWEATQGKATIAFDQLDSFTIGTPSAYSPTNATVTSPTYTPAVVTLKGGKRVVVADSDGAAGELVNVMANVSDSDGTITTFEWLIDGTTVESATGLSPTLTLSNGVNVVTFVTRDKGGKTTRTFQTITVLAPTTPIVSISGGNRTIADTDGVAGESVSFTGTATDSDGTIATTQWLVDGSEVAAGLTATIALPNGSTVVTFKATDNDGASSTTATTITIHAPAYTVTDEWPSPYNGVTPDSSLGLAFNNIGVFSASDSIIYTCLRVFTDGLPGAVGGISEFGIGLRVVSLSEATVQITKFREFNTIGALNENAQTPDCSGIFETTTGIYTDIIVAGDSVLDTTWSLIDPTDLILKLDSFKELTAN